MNILQELASSIVSADRIEDDGVPSISIALLDGTGSPSASVITNGQEDAETLYQACSISKAITALGVAKLVDEGRLSYDTKVVDHIPASIIDTIVDARTTHLMPHVTVGMLLSHHSGLSQHGFPGHTGALPTYEDIFAGRAPSNTQRIRFQSFPGAHFSYSGGGITLLQLFLERLLDRSFADWMKESVLEPLGMARSVFGELSPDEHNYAKAHWTAHVVATDKPEGYWRFVELAAAGLWTTPTDLVRAAAAVQASLANQDDDHHGRDGEKNKKTFLSRATAETMLSTVGVPGMAMGWFADAHFFAHAGDNYPGYTTYLIGSHGGRVNGNNNDHESGSANIDGDSAICIMTNSVRGWPTIQRVLAAIFHLKRWPVFARLPSWVGRPSGLVPYAAPADAALDPRWTEWMGAWGKEEDDDGSEEPVWEIVRHDDSSPALAYGKTNEKDGALPPMRLRVAAAPTQRRDGGHDLVFVVDGLDICVRMTEGRDGKKVVELLQEEIAGDALRLKPRQKQDGAL